MAIRRHPPTTGFTLLEMSIVLVIIAVVTAAGSTLFSASLAKRQQEETKTKLAAIQQALYNYRVANNRLPCPADVRIPVESLNFGIEGANPGVCSGGAPVAFPGAITELWAGFGIFGNDISTPYGPGAPRVTVGWGVSGTNAATGTAVAVANVSVITLTLPPLIPDPSLNFTFTSNVVGMVPTKTLRLPDDYAFDGWGRRIMYTANPSMTVVNAFSITPVTDITQRITIKDASGHTKSPLPSTVPLAIYVVMSFGPNGHGAWPHNGGTTRISTGSNNADELVNCACTNTAADNTVRTARTFIQKAPTQDPTIGDHTNDFDDIVVYGTRADLRTPLE